MMTPVCSPLGTHRVVRHGSPSVHSGRSAASPVLPNFSRARKRAARGAAPRAPDVVLFARRPESESGRRLLEGTPESEASAQEHASCLRPRGARRVRRLVLTACGSDDNSKTGDGTTKPSAAAAGDIKCDGAKGKLLASGSSAQKNAVDLWVKNYMAACSGVEVNYKSSSSGEGIVAFNQGTVGFAGSDSALKPEQVEESKKICTGGQGIDLPMVGGPIALGFNIAGVDKLNLDAPTIANIFNDKIKKWDDEAIKKLNPGVTLPSTAIQHFHRSEDSGTTENLASTSRPPPVTRGRTRPRRSGPPRAASAPPAPPASRPRSSRSTAPSATSSSRTPPRRTSRRST